MIDCKETAFLVDKEDLTGISLGKRMNLKLHLMMCKFCKNYFNDSKAINKMFKRLHSEGGLHQLTVKEKIELKSNLKT